MKEADLKGEDPLLSIARSKPIKLQFTNYLREPTHNRLAKPNPLEWKPLLPGRELKLLSDKAIPSRERLRTLDAILKWELATDNCDFRRGEMRFADIRIVNNKV